MPTTEVAVWVPTTIMKMAGGIRTPKQVAAAMMETVCSGLYPAFSMGGAIIAPMAETSATVEPETPENMISPTTVVIPKPAPDPSHHGPGEVDQAVADAAPFHENAGKDEGRDGQQDPGLDALEDGNGHRGQGVFP